VAIYSNSLGDDLYEYDLYYIKKLHNLLKNHVIKIINGWSLQLPYIGLDKKILKPIWSLNFGITIN